MEPRLSQPTPSILSIVFQVHGGLCAPGAAARSYGGKQLGTTPPSGSVRGLGGSARRLNRSHPGPWDLLQQEAS